MKVYCEHGALSESLKNLQRNGLVELVHFPYDPGSHYPRAAIANPSEARVDDLNLSWSELPGTWNDYCGSEHLSEIQEILVGSQNRRDALHVDSAFRSRCAAFVTRDKGILAHKERLQAVLGMRFFHADDDQDELERFASRAQDGR